MKKRFDLLPLDWDTDYFGINSARVNIYDEIQIEDKEIIKEFISNYAFVTLSNYSNLDYTNLWIGENTNAFLADVNVVLNKNLTNEANNFSNAFAKSHQVLNNLEYNKEIINISKSAFIFSRFFNDPNLPKEKAYRIYEQWCYNSFNKEDKYFVISKLDDYVVGFILFSFDIISLESTIELIAIDKSRQGNSIGKNMLLVLEQFLKEKGIVTIKVGTQVNNANALNFYHNCGYRINVINSIYHLWNL